MRRSHRLLSHAKANKAKTVFCRYNVSFSRGSAYSRDIDAKRKMLRAKKQQKQLLNLVLIGKTGNGKGPFKNYVIPLLKVVFRCMCAKEGALTPT